MYIKIVVVSLVVLVNSFCFSQKVDSLALVNENIEYRQALNEQYTNEATSPMQKKARKKFTGHSFYDINLDYRVVAKLQRTPTARSFQMKTTSSRSHEYRKFGILTFKIKGISLKLSVYQDVPNHPDDPVSSHLFLPFKDKTNGYDTYGGGRYLDLVVPEGDTMIIDFNKAYNPYCHYNVEYSCPLVPRENNLLFRIEAGVKKYPSKGEH
jgi:uncharacterized protein (DUF1684 family)